MTVAASTSSTSSTGSAGSAGAGWPAKAFGPTSAAPCAQARRSGDRVEREAAAVDGICRTICCVARGNDGRRKRPWAGAGHPAPFASGTVPGVPLSTFVRRCLAYLNEVDRVENGPDAAARVSPGFTSLVIALVYVDRLVSRGFELSMGNVHRLLLACLVVATKTWRDSPIPNRFMSRVGGVPLDKLNAYEIRLCTLLAFHTHVSAAQFNETLEGLM